jgi:hypothetical protein
MMVAVVAIISVPPIPIVRPVVRVAVIWSVVIAVGMIVPIRVVPIIARSEPNAEVNLSIRTWRCNEG